jgi:chromosome segregation ATPase
MHAQHDVVADPVQAFLKSLTPEQLKELTAQMNRPKGDDRPITQKDLTDLLGQAQEYTNRLAAAQRTRLDMHAEQQESTNSAIRDLRLDVQRHDRRLNALESRMPALGGFESYGNKVKLDNHEDRLNDYAKRIRSLETKNSDLFEPAANVVALGLGILLLVTIIKVATAPTVVTEAAPV